MTSAHGIDSRLNGEVGQDLEAGQVRAGEVARALRDQRVAADVRYFFGGAHVPVIIEDDPDFAGGRSFINPRIGGRTVAAIQGCGGENRGLRPMRADDRNGLGLMLDDDAIVVCVGKEQAGRELYGRTWDEFPAAVGA